jgi:hypothetical protein
MPHRRADAFYVAVVLSFLCRSYVRSGFVTSYVLRNETRRPTGLRNDLLELPLEVFDLIPEPGGVLELEVLRGLEHLGFEVGD